MEITSKYGRYEIVIEENSLNNLGKYVKLKKALIITEKNIPRAYLEATKKVVDNCYIFISIPGEEAKSLDNYERIIKTLVANTFSRNDYIIALGGGVVTDLAGFVAATYMRGIKYISIPTTTLAMVDASIGSKTALNFQNRKNIIGAFYPPEMVIMDFEVLNTLTKRVFSEGLVEALKCGYIYDATILKLFSDPFKNLKQIIKSSLIVKKTIVEADEKETGIRKILNFGHTYGHALEAYTDYKYYHGECVAYGMYIFLDESLRSEYLMYLKKLEIDITSMPKRELLKPYLLNDKKADNGYIDIVKVAKVGQATIERVALDSL